MKPPPRPARSQVIDLFLGVAEALGFTTDVELAALADAGPESVGNWRNGAVRELKPHKLRAAITSLEAHIHELLVRAGAVGGQTEDLTQLEIERGASPADLQRDFRQRMSYDYIGHRFLYYEPQGALAWESLIRGGYEQDIWLAGIERCIRRWLTEGDKDAPLARALGLVSDRGTTTRGLDIVSLGCGEAGKEGLVLANVLAVDEKLGGRLPWLCFAPVDVSIPLLLTAARTGHNAFARAPVASRRLRVAPFCSDFEEGRLGFRHRLRTAHGAGSEGLRLVVILGNVFGNLRDEELFVRRQLAELCRPGDMVWLEVGLRPDDLDADPLYALTRPDYQETPTAANRRLLLEGPYRRAANAMGAAPAEIDLRISLREADESARIPGSINFTHDILLRAERRSFTMLYSRRYQLAPLLAWLERLGYDAVASERITDGRGTPRVANLLLRRRAG